MRCPPRSVEVGHHGVVGDADFVRVGDDVVLERDRERTHVGRDVYSPTSITTSRSFDGSNRAASASHVGCEIEET
jgi:hypothetical protein